MANYVRVYFVVVVVVDTHDLIAEIHAVQMCASVWHRVHAI